MIRTCCAVLAILTATGCTAAPAQQAARAVPSSLVWSFDRASGAVRPTGTIGNQTSTIYTGTVNIAVTISLHSKLPSGSVFRCNADARLLVNTNVSTVLSASVLGGPYANSESVDGAISGSTATCNFTIPYEWTVPDSTKTATYTVTGISGAITVTEEVLGTTGAVVRTLRSTSVTTQTTAAPPVDNASTDLTASTVL